MTELETVLATLHRSATAMAADHRPPARIRLAVDGVTLEWDLVPGATAEPVDPATPSTAAPVHADTTVPVPVAPGPASAGAATVVGHTLTAPTVGVFYRAPEPGAAPFVDTGDLVGPGQQIGIIEAMKLMIPVEADRGGRIAEVLCADATAVEFGAPLFTLAPAESAG